MSTVTKIWTAPCSTQLLKPNPSFPGPSISRSCQVVLLPNTFHIHPFLCSFLSPELVLTGFSLISIIRKDPRNKPGKTPNIDVPRSSFLVLPNVTVQIKSTITLSDPTAQSTFTTGLQWLYRLHSSLRMWGYKEIFATLFVLGPLWTSSLSIQPNLCWLKLHRHYLTLILQMFLKGSFISRKPSPLKNRLILSA